MRHLLSALGLLLILAIVYLEFGKKREALTFEVKTSMDTKMLSSVHQGATSLLSNIGEQARRIQYAAGGLVPFKHKIRQWKRKLNGRNL